MATPGVPARYLTPDDNRAYKGNMTAKTRETRKQLRRRARRYAASLLRSVRNSNGEFDDLDAVDQSYVYDALDGIAGGLERP